MLREDPSLSSRIASVHYEYYDDIQELDALLLEEQMKSSAWSEVRR